MVCVCVFSNCLSEALDFHLHTRPAHLPCSWSSVDEVKANYVTFLFKAFYWFSFGTMYLTFMIGCCYLFIFCLSGQWGDLVQCGRRWWHGPQLIGVTLPPCGPLRPGRSCRSSLPCLLPQCSASPRWSSVTHCLTAWASMVFSVLLESSSIYLVNKLVTDLDLPWTWRTCFWKLNFRIDSCIQLFISSSSHPF